MEKHVKLSRFLSLVLRHKPGEIGLTLDNQGYLNVAQLIDGINNSGRVITENILEEIVMSDDKGRYSYDKNGDKIRANQGHSIKVDLGLPSKKPPKQLYHGTADRFKDDISKLGLLKGAREYVHLSDNLDTATSVGGRRGQPVIFLINCGLMYDDGYEFYLSENKVWLTKEVPAKYLEIM